MSNPLISIIIPTYNDETYLRQALDSAVSQTLRDIEIICVNDGSTDGTDAILREYAEKDKRIRVIDNPKNLGRLSSRKAGVEAAQGEYCLFLDSDDELFPESGETVYTLIRQQNAECRYCGVQSLCPRLSKRRDCHRSARQRAAGAWAD